MEIDAVPIIRRVRGPGCSCHLLSPSGFTKDTASTLFTGASKEDNCEKNENDSDDGSVNATAGLVIIIICECGW